MNDELLVPNHLKAFVHPEIKAVNKTEREILHLISTDSVDRAGDVVEPGGADIANYMKNPVVMVDHDYRIDRIIGKALSIEINAKGIYARTKFLDTPLAQAAFQLASEGIGGWSIGFRPIDYNSIKDSKGAFKGVKFEKWELLEYSMVAIPMNQDVVNNAVSRGWVTADDCPVFFKTAPKPSEEAAPGPNVEAPIVKFSPDLPGKIAAAQVEIARREAAAKMRRFVESLR